MNYWRLMVIYTVAVIVLHVIPTGGLLELDQEQVLGTRADYLLHMLIFLPWMILVWFHLNSKKIANQERFKLGLFWLLVGLALALSSETIQIFLPYRAYNPLDMIYNMAGILLGSLVFLRKFPHS